MLEVTPLHDGALHHELSDLMKIDFPYARRRAIRLFLLYLIDEDSRYSVVPDHAQYDDQRKLKERLEQQCVELNRHMRTSHSKRYGRRLGIVNCWVEEKGYGFLTPESGGQTIFVHVNDIVNVRGNAVPTGTVIEYDYEEAEKGPKAVNAAILD